MICKDCIHFDRCRGLYRFERLQKAVSKGCPYFKKRARFVELPCMVGDVLYEPFRSQISEYKIEQLLICENCILIKWRLIKGVASNVFGINVDNIGKTVFLSRKEAERASEERRDEY